MHILVACYRIPAFKMLKKKTGSKFCSSWHKYGKMSLQYDFMKPVKKKV